MSKIRIKPYSRKQRVDGIIVEGQTGLKPQPCLGHCGKMFQPLYEYNRQCPECTAANAQIDGREYRVGIDI